MFQHQQCFVTLLGQPQFDLVDTIGSKSAIPPRHDQKVRTLAAQDFGGDLVRCTDIDHYGFAFSQLTTDSAKPPAELGQISKRSPNPLNAEVEPAAQHRTA